MDLEKYTREKHNNLDLNIQEYLELNPDLKKAKIDNVYKIFKHWFQHGTNENRTFNRQNGDLANMWKDINNYLKHNLYRATSVAFIVTTSVRNELQLNYLRECIKHIRNIYSSIYIYVINDCSHLSIDSINGVNIEIIDSLVKGGGEVNPYLFALDERCKHDKLIYIHDTVFIKRNIDVCINSVAEIDFIWYSKRALNNDIFKPENKEILNNFYFYFSNTKISMHQLISIIKMFNIPYTVKFGSMSIFTKEFMRKVDLVTNFRQISHMFNNRTHRCFFERILSFIYIFIYGGDYNIFYSVCGNIFSHPLDFRNTNINIPTRMAMVKVWQGR